MGILLICYPAKITMTPYTLSPMYFITMQQYLCPFASFGTEKKKKKTQR